MRLLQSSWSTANLEFTVRTFNSTFTWVSLISTDCTLVWFHFLQEENELRTTLIFIDPKTRTACWYWCEAAHASVHCHLIAKTCESFQECVLSHIGYWKVKHICCTVIEINWVQRNMPNLWTCNIAWSRGLVARGYSLPSVSLKSEYPGMIIGPHLSSILHKMSPKCSF